MTCIIVDDEIMARKSLQRLCEKEPTLQLVAVCENAAEARRVLTTQAVDLLFLDIEMPDLTGLELLDQLQSYPQVIFTTSKTDYAFEAFSYQATDYLQKPIVFNRFCEAVKKAKYCYELKKNHVPIPQTTPVADTLFIRTEGRLLRLEIEEVLFFENIGDYVSVHTTRGKFIIHATMKGLDEKLTHPNFVKVHRSYIVNTSKIKDIEENTLVIEKKVIPISRANKPILMARLNII